MLISRITGFLVLVFFLALSNLANASPIVWTLKNVVFNDFGTASGTLTVDSATGDLLTLDIVTTPEGGLFPGATYDQLSEVTAWDSYGLLYNNSGGGLALDFSESLTSSGSIDLNGSEYTQIGGYPETRYVSSGYVISDSVSTVPLPASPLLMLTGLTLLALATSRRKAGQSTIFR